MSQLYTEGFKYRWASEEQNVVNVSFVEQQQMKESDLSNID